ncbi:MAG: hypothetical protein P4N59_12120 [Negativicutes bacterium]|nr:hypothetical protein [Negativicutes bacterium]
MKEVRKKSADSAVNQMIVKAFRQQVDLTWDRAEAMQPQCGFGRLAICCSDCFEGPCRVNPFATDKQETICGRDQAAMVASYFAGKTADGTAALVKLAAEFGAEVNQATWQTITASDDTMYIADYASRIDSLGQAATQALTAISKAKTAVYGQPQPDVVPANLGTLTGERVNIVLHGHVAPQTVKALVAAAGASSVPVNIASICGSEGSGALAIPVLTNYDSQETPLLTGAVDLLVLGSQCVMPAVAALAGKLGVPVINAAALKNADEAVAAAVTAFKRRSGKKVDIPAFSQEIYGGYTAANSAALFDTLAKAYKKGTVSGLVYFGGCGNIAKTQDAELVKTAAGLVEKGYFVVTAGCVGTALAKAGLCRPDYAGAKGLKAALPAGIPPVINLGSCHDGGEFIAIAKVVAGSGLPVFAVLPELAHNKTLATAVAFASQGIDTFVGIGEVCLPDGIVGGRIRAYTDLSDLCQPLAEVAAAK